MALGVYPDVSLAKAREQHSAARAWMEEHRLSVTASTHAHTLAWMENDVFPWLGKRPITEIDASETLFVLKRIDGRGARHTAHKIRSKIGMVFRYSIRQGHCKSDPARDLIGTIPSASTTHLPPSPNRPRLARCCGPLTPLPAPSGAVRAQAEPSCCSSDLVNCGQRNGPMLIWIGQSGAI